MGKFQMLASSQAEPLGRSTDRDPVKAGRGTIRPWRQPQPGGEGREASVQSMVGCGVGEYDRVDLIIAGAQGDVANMTRARPGGVLPLGKIAPDEVA